MDQGLAGSGAKKRTCQPDDLMSLIYFGVVMALLTEAKRAGQSPRTANTSPECGRAPLIQLRRSSALESSVTVAMASEL